MTFHDETASLGRSPWLIGLAMGGGMGLLSFLTDAGPLPLKLLGAVGGGSLCALRTARRNARKRLGRQRDAALRSRQAVEAGIELGDGPPAGLDFRSEMGRRSAVAERARFETRCFDGAVEAPPRAAPRSDVDERCEALERSLRSSGRAF